MFCFQWRIIKLFWHIHIHACMILTEWNYWLHWLVGIRFTNWYCCWLNGVLFPCGYTAVGYAWICLPWSCFVVSKYGEAGRGEEGEGEWREKGEGESEWINEAHTYRVLHPSHGPHGPPVHSFREVSWAEPWCIECGDVELVDWVPGIVHTLRGMCKLFWCLKK